MPDVFVSYQRQDKERAQHIVNLLKNNEFDVWWDQYLLAGTQARTEITRQLDDSTCVVVLWSSKSIISEWVLGEASRALKRHALIPILLDQVQLPLGFSELQTIDLSEWVGDESHTAVQSLLASIRHMLATNSSFESEHGSNSAPINMGTTLDLDSLSIDDKVAIVRTLGQRAIAPTVQDKKSE